jgi:hypothetical protein
MLSKLRMMKVTIETTAGTKVAGTTACLVEDLEIKPTAPFDQRPGGGIYLGKNYPGVLGERSGSCSFKMELRSSAGVTFTMPKAQYTELSLGDREGLQIYDAKVDLNNSSGNDFLTINKGAGTLGSGIDECLKAVGFVLASTTYSPHSVQANQKTLSIDVWEDGVKKGLAGAQGKMTIEVETGKRVMLNFEFSGVWVAPVAEALPAFAPGTTAVQRAQGGTFTVGGTAKKISKLTIDVGQKVAPRMDVNAAGGIANYDITDYDPTASFDIEAEAVGTYDINGIWLAGTEAAIVLVTA